MAAAILMPYDPERHGPQRIVGPGFHRQVYAVVRRIPRGRVATYGDVGAALGSSSVARQVGFALAAVPPEERGLPWHRVVNAQGKVSARAAGDHQGEQRRRLEREGVRFSDGGRILDFASVRHDFGGPPPVTGPR